jgi:hypothetical protein
MWKQSKHFHDEAVFTSPVAQQIGFVDGGVVIGKDALRDYWTAALAQNPHTRFQVSAVYRGVNTLVIAYKNQNAIDRVEVLMFRGSASNIPFGERTAQVDFTPHDKSVNVRVTFDAEDTHPVEMQRGGWQAIFNNFARYAEGARHQRISRASR